MPRSKKKGRQGRCKKSSSERCRVPHNLPGQSIGDLSVSQLTASTNYNCPPFSQSHENLRATLVVQKNSILLFGLPRSKFHSKDVLLDFLSKYGKICRCVIDPKNASVDESDAKNFGTNLTCSAYVTFSSEKSALSAFRATHGMEIHDSLDDTRSSKILKSCIAVTGYCDEFIAGNQCSDIECILMHENAEDNLLLPKEERGHQSRFQSSMVPEDGMKELSSVAERRNNNDIMSNNNGLFLLVHDHDDLSLSNLNESCEYSSQSLQSDASQGHSICISPLDLSDFFHGHDDSNKNFTLAPLTSSSNQATSEVNTEYLSDLPARCLFKSWSWNSNSRVVAPPKKIEDDEDFSEKKATWKVYDSPWDFGLQSPLIGGVNDFSCDTHLARTNNSEMGRSSFPTNAVTTANCTNTEAVVVSTSNPNCAEKINCSLFCCLNSNVSKRDDTAWTDRERSHRRYSMIPVLASHAYATGNRGHSEYEARAGCRAYSIEAGDCCNFDSSCINFGFYQRDTFNSYEDSYIPRSLLPRALPDTAFSNTYLQGMKRWV